MSQPRLTQRIPLNIPWLSYKRSTAPAQFAKAPAAEPKNACLSEINAARLPGAQRLLKLDNAVCDNQQWHADGVRGQGTWITLLWLEWIAHRGQHLVEGTLHAKTPIPPRAVGGTEPRGVWMTSTFVVGKMHLNVGCWMRLGIRAFVYFILRVKLAAVSFS